ncbi:MAG: regulatory protein RecX [Clostridia bacterium]|nr:regulatory protein RecX [Lachnospiraceae bacterium]NCB99279.1 regulatory protein RecX [Clostridia bacterium]NCD01428.1 regulatory protein RecX [Clostridia bacterium]
MQISYIEKSGKNKVRITLADGDKFIISERDWRSFGVDAGDEIEDDILNKLYTEYLLPKAKFRALNLLKMRDRSRQELRQRLKQDGYPEIVIQKTIEYIDGYHYLDDVRFAKNYVDYRGKRKSRRELEYELSGKGIDLRSMSLEGEEFNMPEDKDTIRSLLLKRWGEHPSPDQKERDRMLRYLARHGFGSGDILSVYRELDI